MRVIITYTNNNLDGIEAGLQLSRISQRWNLYCISEQEKERGDRPLTRRQEVLQFKNT